MLKYECDECGQLVVDEEALGTGVYRPDHHHPEVWVKGKGYQQKESGGFTVNILISMNDAPDEHYCKACMWKAVERLIDQFGPQEVEPVVTEAAKEAWSAMAYKAGLWPGRWEEEAVKMEVEMDGNFADGGTVVLPAGLPKPPFIIKVVPNEETNYQSEGSDTELPQLYFEGVLQESGPDEPADDPGPSKTSDIPNRYDRPGWEYKSTANGI